MEFEIE